MNSIRNLDGRVNRFRASQRAANPLAVSAARIALRISNLLKVFDALAIPFHQLNPQPRRSRQPIPSLSCATKPNMKLFRQVPGTKFRKAPVK